jgi:hypothetical protein
MLLQFGNLELVIQAKYNGNPLACFYALKSAIRHRWDPIDKSRLNVIFPARKEGLGCGRIG